MKNLFSDLYETIELRKKSNKKNSYRSLNTIDQKIDIFSEKLPILEDDTKNIIEYVEQSNQTKKKKFNFWKLLDANE